MRQIQDGWEVFKTKTEEIWKSLQKLTFNEKVLILFFIDDFSYKTVLCKTQLNVIYPFFIWATKENSYLRYFTK